MRFLFLFFGGEEIFKFISQFFFLKMKTLYNHLTPKPMRFVFIFGCVGSLLLRAGHYFLLQCAGFSLRWLALLQSTGFRCAGFRSCSAWAQLLWLTGSRMQAQ